MFHGRFLVVVEGRRQGVFAFATPLYHKAESDILQIKRKNKHKSNGFFCPLAHRLPHAAAEDALEVGKRRVAAHVGDGGRRDAARDKFLYAGEPDEMDFVEQRVADGRAEAERAQTLPSRYCTTTVRCS